jgi:hypothetical protein
MIGVDTIGEIRRAFFERHLPIKGKRRGGDTLRLGGLL